MGGLSRRLKRTTKQYIIVCILAILVSGGAAAGISINIIDETRSECERELNKCYTQMNENKRTVYITKKDIRAGEVLTEDCVGLENVYATQPQNTYIDENDIGKILLVDVLTGTHMLKSMVTDTDVDGSIREAEFNTILISSNMLENEVVDIRIAYPNGEDYTVLAKKVLKGYKGDTPNCFLWLSEEEIIRMHNAIVDAYLYTGACLYTTKYIEPNLQKATIANYTPTVEAIKLIQKNPNILQTAINELSTSVRKALENRLAESMNKDVSKENWNIGSNYIYQESYTQQKREDIKTTKPSQAAITGNDTDIVPAVTPESGTQSNLAAPPDTADLPRTGDLEEDDNINENNGAELGKNSGITDKNNMKSSYRTDYFAVTEG